MLEWLVTSKGEPRKVKNKTLENDLLVTLHNGSQFDTYVILDNLSNWQKTVSILKNGKCFNSLNVLNKNI